ncbi:zinc finger, HIT-type protein [Pseudohyphozyma bogoriensis]|nr:zinc finger, HIT-type protein [Pseudohyphozyma bogoriensis]
MARPGMQRPSAPEIIIGSSSSRRRGTPISSAEQPICGVCKLQFSRYTCPHCNLHYCSIPCFRSEAHNGCSESFDRKSLLEDIEGGEKSAEEKKRMVEMLRRFEEESLRADEEESEDEDGEEDDTERAALEEKLRGVDLDALTPEQVLELLSPAQQAAFTATLNDPAKMEALMRDEFEGDAPWWEAEDEEAERSSEDEDEEDDLEEQRPQLVDEAVLPTLKIGDDGKVVVNSQLVYNVVAVLFAYAYTLRTFSLSSFSSLRPESTERTTAIDMLSALCPLLIEKSALVLEDIGGAIEYVVAREKPDRPTTTRPPSAANDAKLKLAKHKILFYVAVLVHPQTKVTTEALRMISERVGVEADVREAEVKRREEGIERRREERERVGKEESKGAKIVEIA